MMKNIIEHLKLSDFRGFHSIEYLRQNINIIPKEKGVYIVLRLSNEEPSFIERKNMGYPIEECKRNWINNEPIIYIGKAGPSPDRTLRKRLKEYMDFGINKSQTHKGGRLIWQLKDSNELIVCWKVLVDRNPKDYEKKMLLDFKEEKGKYPFANYPNCKR